MIISQTVGVNFTNCYLIGKKNGNAIIVDPGDEANKIMDMIVKNNVKVDKIINTHGHFDHIAANLKIKEATNAEIYIHKDDQKALIDPIKNLSVKLGKTNLVKLKKPDNLIKEGDIIEVEDYKFKIIHTPGHSPGSICLYDKGKGVLISGDTIFNMGIGRTDFLDSSHKTLMKSIKKKILPLPDETEVYPGHGQATTIKKFKNNVYKRFTR